MQIIGALTQFLLSGVGKKKTNLAGRLKIGENINIYFRGVV